MDNERRAFDRLLDAVLSGRLTRRQMLVRATALGLSATAIRHLSTAARSLQDETPKPGGILKVGMQADPTSLDPHTQTLTALFHVTEHIYSTLVRITPQLTVEPDLAESWEISPDGLTYTFKIRQGVTFHNGRPAVAGDVKYSYERILNPDTASPNVQDLASVDTIEAPDDATLVITLKSPDASFLTTLTGASNAIVPREVVEENGDLTQVAIGTGPFIFKEYVPNTRIVLEKNPNYWESGKPYVDGMEMIVASDDTSRTTAVVTGTVDIVEYAPLRDIAILEDDSSIVLAGNANTNIRFIAVNVNKEPFNNPLVRQAIAAVIERDAIVAAAVNGHGTPTQVLFPESYWAALKQPVTPPDVERAKQLLTEAGYPDGFSATIQSWSAYSFLSNAAIVVQEQLKQIGIETEVDLQENATYIDNYFKHNFDLSVTGTSAYVDPNDIFFGNFRTGSATNAADYSNPEADALIDQGIQETDPAKRTEIYLQLQTLLLEDLPWINLFIANQYEAMKTYVKGYTHIPTGTNIALRETWLDK